MTTLSLATLPQVATGVARPAYDPAKVEIGIIHLGLGAFYRAHGAEFVDAMLERDPSWGICGVSLKTPTAKQLLEPQNGLYTLLKKSAERNDARVIGSVREVMFLGTDRAALMARFAD